MSITFDIRDVTTLTGKKEVSVQVTALTANDDEMDFASHLTKTVKESAMNYATKGGAK